MNFPQDLLPGDVLLYDLPHDLADAVICVDTGSDVAHAELYWGNGLSIAARAQGVNAYDFRSVGLMYVRRPVAPFNRSLAEAWFNNGIRGLPYGWEGLLTFINVELPSKGLICSVTDALLLKAGQTPCFADDYPIHKISPRDLKLPRELTTIWTKQNV
jgi:hypothetical protein